MTQPRRSLGSLFRNVCGAAAVEVALFAPLLVGICLGAFELGRYCLVNLKTFNAAASVADLVGRTETASIADLQDVFAAAQHILKPFDLDGDGTVIVSAVSADVDDVPVVFWQVAGGGALTPASEIGQPGSGATLPGDLPIRAKETIVVAEVFYRYVPMFASHAELNATIRHASYFRPRLGSLRSLQ